MACDKFVVLSGPIRIRDPDNVNLVIKVACILHNYVRKKEGLQYTSTYPISCESNTHIDIRPLPQNLTINITSSAAALRYYLADYFLTPQASLPWQ